MGADVMELPEGFVLDGPEQAQGLPEGFVLDQPESPQGSMASYVVEPLRAIGSGVVNQIQAGYKGIATPANSFTEPLSETYARAGDRVTQALQNYGQYTPQTQRGQKGLEVVGDIAEGITDAAQFFPKYAMALGELVRSGNMDDARALVARVDEIGVFPAIAERGQDAGILSPAGATAVSMAPDIAGAATGSRAPKAIADARLAAKPHLFKIMDAEGLTPEMRKQIQKAGGFSGEVTPDNLAGLPKDISPKKALPAIIENKIKSGSREDMLAEYMLGPKGGVIDDEIAKEAIKQGISSGDIMAVKSASHETLEGMKKILREHRRGRANTSTQSRHTDVVGDSAMDRFMHIRHQANKDRAELNQLAENELAGKAINGDTVATAFFDGLAEIGVKVDRSSLPPKLDFTGSDVVKNPSSRRIIKDTLDLLAEPGRVDALRAHKVKRQLDDLIDFRKKSSGGISEKGRNFAKAIRAALNQSVRDVSPRYAELNDRMSMSIRAMDDFDSAMGAQIDMFADSANTAVGTNLRKLLSNYAVRGKMLDAVQQLDDAAKELGGEFSDNLYDLTNFAKSMDVNIGTNVRGSFAGETKTAVAQGVTEAVASPKMAMFRRVADKGAQMYEESRGVNPDNAYRALESLINREMANKPKKARTSNSRDLTTP